MPSPLGASHLQWWQCSHLLVPYKSGREREGQWHNIYKELSDFRVKALIETFYFGQTWAKVSKQSPISVRQAMKGIQHVPLWLCGTPLWEQIPRTLRWAKDTVPTSAIWVSGMDLIWFTPSLIQPRREQQGRNCCTVFRWHPSQPPGSPPPLRADLLCCMEEQGYSHGSCKTISNCDGSRTH